VCSSKVAVDRLKEVADLPSEEDKSGVNYKEDGWMRDNFNIVFDDVTVRYRPDDPPAVKNINISIARGERIAFVGRTGSGY
jgi:ABC-type bacteriocin/lantibiotic exporter with double-glycine peptidase domain